VKARLGGTALAAALLAAAPARAEGDGLYGRFAGDVELRGAAGVAVVAGGPMIAGEIGARYLSSAGIFVGYADAAGGRKPRVLRSIAAGVEVAPFFLTRYASNAERGPAHLDLLLDSLAFGVGAFWAQPQGSAFGARPGLEIALSMSIPILPRIDGPILGVRGALRWRDEDLGGRPEGVVDRGALLSFTIGWRQVVHTHLVDPGDEAFR
jgi:hypothetical protein